MPPAERNSNTLCYLWANYLINPQPRNIYALKTAFIRDRLS
jgi:hypothetical protein